jgi:hypothetical protein
MNNISPDSLVLGGIMLHLQDLEITCLLGGCWIPQQWVQKIIDVELIASYQTTASGKEHRWKMENQGEVNGHELPTRADLFKDEQDHLRSGYQA